LANLATIPPHRSTRTHGPRSMRAWADYEDSQARVPGTRRPARARWMLEQTYRSSKHKRRLITLLAHPPCRRASFICAASSPPVAPTGTGSGTTSAKSYRRRKRMSSVRKLGWSDFDRTTHARDGQSRRPMAPSPAYRTVGRSALPRERPSQHREETLERPITGSVAQRPVSRPTCARRRRSEGRPPPD
jgi:hypothetical protein